MYTGRYGMDKDSMGGDGTEDVVWWRWYRGIDTTYRWHMGAGIDGDGTEEMVRVEVVGK